MERQTMGIAGISRDGQDGRVSVAYPSYTGSDTLPRQIAARLAENAAVNAAIAQRQCEIIARMAGCIVNAYRNGGKLLIFGNGGSAADAQHIAGEFMGTFLVRSRRALPALALSTNTSIVTALANDFGYETIFARQVEALAREEDVVMGISTSGKSANVVAAIKMAKHKRATTMVLTGCDGGILANIADYAFVAPSDSTPRIQEAHITVGHIICEIVEQAFTRNEPGS